MKEIKIQPIGMVRRGKKLTVEIDEKYRPALKTLGKFSHVIVLWWAHGLDNEEYRNLLQTDPPYAPEHTTGVFATRAPYRPNPIGFSVCPISNVDEEKGIVTVTDIDAVDETPVLDLKAYFPVCDRVRSAHIPEWLSDWPEWMPDEGIPLEEYGQE